MNGYINILLIFMFLTGATYLGSSLAFIVLTEELREGINECRGLN